METKQFTNPDRNRYYGLRQGDVVIPQYQKERICEVEPSQKKKATLGA